MLHCARDADGKRAPDGASTNSARPGARFKSSPQGKTTGPARSRRAGLSRPHRRPFRSQNGSSDRASCSQWRCTLCHGRRPLPPPANKIHTYGVPHTVLAGMNNPPATSHENQRLLVFPLRKKQGPRPVGIVHPTVLGECLAQRLDKAFTTLQHGVFFSSSFEPRKTTTRSKEASDQTGMATMRAGEALAGT